MWYHYDDINYDDQADLDDLDRHRHDLWYRLDSGQADAPIDIAYVYHYDTGE